MPEMRRILWDRPLTNICKVVLVLAVVSTLMIAGATEELPLCQGKDSRNWDRCVGTVTVKGEYAYKGEFRLRKKMVTEYT